MKIAVVGAGGREHAIIKKLNENSTISEIYALPGNGGISQDAKCVDIKPTDITGVVNFCKDNNIDLCVVTPDDPLVLGMVDELEKVGVRAFGPSKLASEIEGSKVYSKELMKKYNIPTAGYETFDNSKQAIEYVEKQNKFPTVIKADGLALGKGVIIAEDLQTAIDGIKSIMDDKQFGDSGNSIVIEEFMTGPEVSVLAFCDGKTIVPMVSSKDHKRALDGDKGLNTGGMGTVAPNPHYTNEHQKECMENIFVPTMEALNSEGRVFKGIIFFGLMITPNGVKVVEYNCRFGDPETQVVIPLLESDLLTIFQAVIDQKLDTVDVKFSSKSASCVVVASGGYPKSYETGKVIKGLDSITEARIYHAGTTISDGNLVTSGGRVLGVTCIADNLADALKSSYNEVNKLNFDKMYYRTDIGK